jgi:hypothetical protein
VTRPASSPLSTNSFGVCPAGVLFRILVVGSLAAFALAVAVGRASPGSGPTRFPSIPGPVPVRCSEFWQATGAIWLDPVSGRLCPPRRSRVGLMTTWAVVARFDESGGSEVVGGLIRFDSEAPEPGCYLARVSHPSGEIIDAVPLPVTLSAPPCWDPDRPGLVFFALVDGGLASWDFAADAGSVVRAQGRWRLRWLVDPSRRPRGRVEGLAWLGGRSKGSGGRLIASVGKERPRLWWLQLDPSGEAVIGCGLLAEGVGETQPDEGFPATWTSPGREARVAYLTRPSPEAPWRLAVGVVEEVEGALPALCESILLRPEVEFLPTPPTFAPDGGTVFAVAGSPSDPRVVRGDWPGEARTIDPDD